MDATLTRASARAASRNGATRVRHDGRAREARPRQAQAVAPTGLPILALALMAAAGFITMVTEALPVALTPAIRADLGWSDARVATLVTAYGIGCGVAALPMALLTRSFPRRGLLLTILGAFAAANLVPAVSGSYPLLIVTRVFAGACAGLLWAMLAGYSTRIAPKGSEGRAMAIAMAGTPLALSLGIPVSNALGSLVGWRATFVVFSLLAVLVLLLGMKVLPPVAGESHAQRRSLRAVLRLPGLVPVLAVTALVSFGHNLVYTFIPALTRDVSGAGLGTLLLAFGLAAVAGLTIVGRRVDRELHVLLPVTALAMAGTLGLLWLALGRATWATLLPVVLWGLLFGGAPTLLQTASARICGDAQEVGQALVVTLWNVMAGLSASAGGVMLGTGPRLLPLAGAAILLVAFVALLETRPVAPPPVVPAPLDHDLFRPLPKSPEATPGASSGATAAPAPRTATTAPDPAPRTTTPARRSAAPAQRTAAPAPQSATPAPRPAAPVPPRTSSVRPPAGSATQPFDEEIFRSTPRQRPPARTAAPQPGARAATAQRRPSTPIPSDSLAATQQMDLRALREPGPAPRREPGPAPRREPGPAPRREPGPAPRREPDPAPRREPDPVPRREPGPAPRRESSSAPRRESNPTPRRESSSAPRRESNPTPRPGTGPESAPVPGRAAPVTPSRGLRAPYRDAEPEPEVVAVASGPRRAAQATPGPRRAL